jgi:hypothetical protein
VRLILSLHGRKNMHVFCKIALLDSSYLYYENAVIGTVLEWYSPLEWWRNQLGSVLNEVKERRLTPEAISKLKTVFMLD